MLSGMLLKVIGIVIILIVGWVVGRLLGKGLSSILGRLGVEDALRNTVIGNVLKRSRFTLVSLFDFFIRWFIYFIAVLAVVEVLEIAALSAFMSSVVQYFPHFIAGILILVVGFLVAGYIGGLIEAFGQEAKIRFITLLADGVKLFMYLIVIIIALTMMRVDVSILYTFSNALAWSIAIGIGVGLGVAFGWGFKDAVAKNAEEWISTAQSTAKKAEEFWSWYTRKEEGKD